MDDDERPWRHTLEPVKLTFERDFAVLKQTHKFIELASMREANRVWEELLVEFGGENYDGGDAYYDMEQRLGADPYEVVAYNGVTSLSRAVSLFELTIARIAACFFEQDSGVVFRFGQSWSRGECEDFYRTCLVSPINPYGTHLKPLLQLRDRFAHGYGEFEDEETANRLARLLHQQMDTAAPTQAESELGFGPEVYFFGRYVSYDSSSGLSGNFFAPIKAELSPLATHRMLLLVRDRTLEVLDHAEFGLLASPELNNSRFFRQLAARTGDGR